MKQILIFLVGCLLGFLIVKLNEPKKPKITDYKAEMQKLFRLQYRKELDSIIEDQLKSGGNYLYTQDSLIRTP